MKNPSFSSIGRQLLTASYLLLFFFTNIQASVVFTNELSGTKTAEGNELSWSTSSETDCLFFIIENSMDGVTFNTVATLPATNNAGEERVYKYIDKQNQSRRIFYRLTEIADKGKMTYTHSIVLSDKREDAKFQLERIAAGATYEDYQATITAMMAGDFNYRIMTQMGELLSKGNIAVQVGQNDIKISTKDLGVGSYQLALKLGNDIEIFKIKKLAAPDSPQINMAKKE